ncbi:MAG TPA: PQQ-dependent sugar dehydrogenase [Thermoanaerobaculia bacterium]|nr:PQQ-dependent sugar dehydrogenase [Thermoanaerobaculia bacterium]
MSRRPRTSLSTFWKSIAGAAAGLLLPAALLAQSQVTHVSAPAIMPGQFFATVPVVNGLSSPIGVTNAGDGSNRLFVVEQRGRVRIVRNGALVAMPFLDISGKVGPCGTSCDERGLLGLAFHPDYETNGFLYVFYTRVSDGDIVIARYQVSADPNDADETTEQILLIIDHPRTNHNGGHLAFGPDGFLYAATGDGGGGGDPDGNGQNINTLLGKILRLDVSSDDFPADPNRNYRIPAGNPFAGPTVGADEVWAYGLRNPWRFSFDRQTGDLYIGDVGQDFWEEIDLQPAGSAGGLNYGWNCREGAHPFNGCTATAGLTDPVMEYSSGSGSGNCSVTGGYVFRGQPAGSFSGRYFFADLCSGRIWSGRQTGGTWSYRLEEDTSFSVTSFGEDEQGRLYFTDFNQSSLRRIAPHTFSDVPPSLGIWPFVEAIVAAGITGGCSDTTFCPDTLVTRAQIAVFLLTAKHGAGFTPPPATGTVFNDVPANSFAAAWIEQLAAEFITGGCGGGNFCPNGSVTREQMAVFLLLALEGSGYTPPACTTPVFADVPCSSPFARWINEIAARGVTAGCGGGNFCPGDAVTRGQMSVFLSASFDLTTP